MCEEKFREKLDNLISSRKEHDLPLLQSKYTHNSSNWWFTWMSPIPFKSLILFTRSLQSMLKAGKRNWVHSDSIRMSEIPSLHSGWLYITWIVRRDLKRKEGVYISLSASFSKLLTNIHTLCNSMARLEWLLVVPHSPKSPVRTQNKYRTTLLSRILLCELEYKPRKEQFCKDNIPFISLENRQALEDIVRNAK